MSDLDKNVNELIDNLENPDNAKEVKEVILTNPIEQLGNDMFGFFRQRIAHIMKISEFKDKVQQKLLEKLEQNPEVSFSEISRLFLDLTEQETLAAQQVVSLLKPPQSSPTNPIFGALQPKTTTSTGEVVYDTETQRKVDIICRFLEVADQVPKLKKDN